MPHTIKQHTNLPHGGHISPLRSLLSRGVFDNLLEQFMADVNGEMSQIMSVSMDVAETDQAFEVTVDLPGIEPDDVEIRVDNNTLTVRGTRRVEKDDSDKEKHYHRMERYSGSFSRSVILPNSINEEEAAAEFKSGVLWITVPKSDDAKPRRINITK